MDDEQSRNPWTTGSVRTVYDNPWIRVDEHAVLNPRGRPGIYGVVHYKNLALGVLPIDAAGGTVLVGQYRYPMNKYTWEIPEGGGRRDVAPLDSIRRELAEETGLAAAQWLEVLRMDLSNAIGDETAICWLAWDLTQGTAAPEETEELRLRRLTYRELVAQVLAGEVLDALSVATVLKVETLRLSGRLPPDVARLLTGA